MRVSEIINGATRCRRGSATLAALVLMCALVLPTGAFAADVFVTTAIDRVDGSVQSVDQLNAFKGADGFISLREAVLAASGEVVPTQIILDDSVYVLGSSQTVVSEGLLPEVMGGSLAIDGSTRIVGSGAEITYAVPSPVHDRIFDVDPSLAGGVSFELEGVRLTNGWAEGAVGGGAIRAGGAPDTAPLSAVTLTRCDLVGNRSTPVAAASSGGALNIGGNVDLRIDGCTFSDNSALGVGGAIFIADSGAGSLLVTDTVFSANKSDGAGVSAGQGGAIYAGVGSGGGTIMASSFSSNLATSTGGFGPDRGGALFLGGSFQIHDCRIANNTADEAPGVFTFRGTTNAEDNWWGSNASPLTAPIQAVGVDADSWLRLTVTPTATVPQNQSVALTASVGGGAHVWATDGSTVAFASGPLGTMEPVDAPVLAGNAESIFTAANDGGLTWASATYDDATVTAEVSVTSAPQITVSGEVTFTVGVEDSMLASVDSYPTTTLAMSGVLPDGLLFTPSGSTATIAGTPAPGTGGLHRVDLTAANGTAPDAATSVTIAIREAASFTPASAATFSEEAAGRFDIATDGFPDATISALDPLPAGLALTDNGDGTASISGTPAKRSFGVHVIRLSADNGVGVAAEHAFTITIERAEPAWAIRQFTWDLQGDFENNANTTAEKTTTQGVVTTHVPGNVELPALAAVSARYYRTVGLYSDGTARAQGLNDDGECDVTGWTDLTAVAGGFYHTLGLQSDGTVVAAGSNYEGESDVTGWRDITAIAAGAFHSVGLRSDGTVVATGSNYYGESDVSGWSDITAISTLDGHTLGLKADGTVEAVGYSDDGECDVSQWDSIKEVSAGSTHSLGLRFDGTVAAVGANAFGQCDVSEWRDIVAISAGADFSLGLTSGGEIVSTGRNDFGQLSFPDRSDYTAVAAGTYHSAALTSDGTFISQGRDSDGQSAMPGVFTSPGGVGTIGGGGLTVGLRAAAEPGIFSGWRRLTAQTTPLGAGQSVKFAARVSGDGETWSPLLGRDGLPIDWTTGTGNYLGQAYSDAAAYTNLSALPWSRFIDITVMLESEGGPTLALQGVTVTSYRDDLAAPTVTHDAPSGWRTSDVTVTVTATDTVSGVASIDCIAAGPGSPLVTLTSETAVVPVSTDGTTTITYSAIDVAENRSVPASTTVRIDKTAPALRILDSAGMVTLTAEDTVSGIDDTWYRVDQGAAQLYLGMPFAVGDSGHHQVIAWTSDIAGNLTVETADVVVDTQDPTVSDDAPSGWRTSDVTVTVSAIDAITEIATIDLIVTDPDGALTVTSLATDTVEVPVTAEGTTTIEYSAIDTAGNRCASETVDVQMDKTAPTSNASHATGWINGPVAVSLSSDDLTSGVRSIWYRTDTAAEWTPYAGVFEITEPGVTTVSFWSEDIAGNSEEPQTTQVFIDAGAPTVSDDAPIGWQRADVNVTLTAHDALASEATIDYAISGAGGTSAATVTGPSATLPVTAQGVTIIEYSATDVAGNRCATETATIRIDKALPVTRASHVIGWSKDAVTVTLTADDPDSGVAATWYRIGSGAAALYSGPFAVGATGATTVTFWSTDNAGNAETEQSTVVRVDTLAPETTSDADAGYLVGFGGTIHLTATDTGSGVASTRWRLGSDPMVAGVAVPIPTSAGTFVLEWASTDAAGNVETTRRATFTVAAKAVVRLGGDDRYHVAAVSAARGWDPDGNGQWPGVKHVIIASGDPGAEADPLCAAGLAGVYDAPVLLVRKASVPAVTKAALVEMAENNPGLKIHVVGGKSSVPDARVKELKSIPGVNQKADRISGADRYEVSANIAKRMVSVVGTDAVGGILLVCAEKPAAFHDALAAGPIAYAKHMPLVAVRSSSLPAVTAEVIASMKSAGKPVYSASSSKWIGSVPAAGAQRLTASSSRYVTAADIASRAVAEGWLKKAEVGLASQLSDAMTGGAFLGKRGGVLLYTDTSTTMQPASKSYLTAHRGEITRGWIMGGIASVKPSIHTTFKALIQ